MKETLIRTILGPMIPDWPEKKESLTATQQAMKVKGSASGEPGKANPPIPEEPTDPLSPS